MLYIIVYDVTDDETRNQIRETLKDAGGTRIQYSAFTIELTRTEKQQLTTKLATLATKTEADIRLIPICPKDKQKTTHITNKPQPQKQTII